MLSGYHVRHLIAVWAISNVCGPPSTLFGCGIGAPGGTSLITCHILCWSITKFLLMVYAGAMPFLFSEFIVVYFEFLFKLYLFFARINLYVSSSILLLTAFAFQYVTLHLHFKSRNFLKQYIFFSGVPIDFCIFDALIFVFISVSLLLHVAFVF